MSALNPIMLPDYELAVRASRAEVEVRAEAIAAAPKFTEPDWGSTMSRNLIAAVAVMTAFACADPAAVTSPGAAGAMAFASVAPCTAEQGQQLIDAGQYKQAIREFTCLISLDPTAVEGYRGPDRGPAHAWPLLRCGARLHPRDRVRAAGPPGRRRRDHRRVPGAARRCTGCNPGAHGPEFRALVFLRLSGRDRRHRAPDRSTAERRLRAPLPRLQPTAPRHPPDDRRGGPRARNRAGPHESRRPVHRRRRVHLRGGAGCRACVRRGDACPRGRARHTTHPGHPRQCIRRLR